METIERGPADEFEVVWKNGHVDRFKAHQVTWPDSSFSLATMMHDGPMKPRRVQFHAEIEGRWTLMLSALEDDISVIRNVTHARDEVSG